METSYLYNIVNSIDINRLSPLWKGVEINTFSADKTLYAYQQEALANALKALFAFYQHANTKDTDTDFDTDRLKKDFSRLAQQHGLDFAAQKKIFAYSNRDSKAYAILADYYAENDNELPAYHFLNRMSFWMATGSGKSIVLIKLMEMLHSLMTNNCIPQNDILFLSHRPDLIEQLKTQNRLAELCCGELIHNLH